MITDSGHSIGGVALPSGTRWIDRRQEPLVSQIVRRSLNQGVDVYAEAVIRGRVITLEIQRPYGWLYDDRYQQLRALAVTPGAQHAFIWRLPDGSTETYTVIFRHNDPPALDFRAVESPAARIDLSIWEGQIKLFGVA